MPLIATIFAILLFVTSVATTNNYTLQKWGQSTEAAAIAGNLAVYRNAVLTYAQANPGVTGSVSDSSLSLPTWFSKITGVSNYVSAGRGHVYYSTPTPEGAYLILKASNNTIRAGLMRSGYLYNPLSGSTSISLPAAIPEGSVVYADG
jgi:hypothetical protein